MASLSVGDKAPDFNMVDQNGQKVALKESLAKGPVVLIFYPGDQTPGCTKQLCAARDSAEEYAAAGVSVFGVNPGGEDSHQRFIGKHNLSMPLLVDKGLEVAGRYNATLGFGLLKLVNRTVVGINPDGRIVYYKRGMPSTQEILAVFKAATPA